MSNSKTNWTDWERTRSTPAPVGRRVGNKERDVHAEYVSEAYAAGYLNDDELKERRDKVLEARFDTDLNAIVEDLPAYAELKGIEVIPKKVRKWGLGTIIDAHQVLIPFIGFLFGLMVAIAPSVVISDLHLVHLFPFNMIMVITLVAGIGTAIAGFGRLIWLGIDETA